jgi:hypothetical protein
MFRPRKSRIGRNISEVVAAAQQRHVRRATALLLTGELTRLLARVLICSYYTNLVGSEVRCGVSGVCCQHTGAMRGGHDCQRCCCCCCCHARARVHVDKRMHACTHARTRARTQIETWHHLRTVEAQRAFMRWAPEPGVELRPLPFPLLKALLLSTAALVAAVGGHTAPAAAVPASVVLLGYTVWKDARLTWALLANVFRQGCVRGATSALAQQTCGAAGTQCVQACFLQQGDEPTSRCRTLTCVECARACRRANNAGAAPRSC